SRRRIAERVEVERRLLVRVRFTKRAHDFGLPLDRIDGLESQLRDALLLPTLAHRGRRRLAAEERPRPFRVPGTSLIVADPAGSCGEHGVATSIEGIRWNEDDELPVHARHRIDRPDSARLLRRIGCVPVFALAAVIALVAGLPPSARGPDPAERS